MTSPWKRFSLLSVLAAALLLRFAYWLTVRDQPFIGELAMDSEEYDRWARALAFGGGDGGREFFQAPLYPYLLSGVYRLFGARLDAVYLLQIVFAVAGVYALYRAAPLLAPGGRDLGLAAAALAALYSPFLFHDVQLLKESLAVSASCFLLWGWGVALRSWRQGGPRPAVAWGFAGVLLGVLVLLRENALLLLPFLLVPLLLGPRADDDKDRADGGRWIRTALGGAALVVGLAVALLPVTVRHLRQGSGFLPTTSQGGVNFWIGNNPVADGAYRPLTPGRQIPGYERREATRLAELDLGRELSPAQVSRYWLGGALDWAARNPGKFLRLQLRKLRLYASWYEAPDAVDYYWLAGRSPFLGWPLLEFPGAMLLALVGLWLERRRLRQWLPVLLWITGWTLSTVAFFVFSRYRLPMVPALLLLAAVPIVALVRGQTVRKRVALAALVAIAWLAPLALAYEPRLDLVTYNLARLHQQAGRIEQAEAEYRRAAELNPEDYLAPLNLGTIAARRGDLEEALGWFERAVEIAPESSDALANLGSTYLAIGDRDRARGPLDRALEIDAENPVALHNRILLARAEGDEAVVSELTRRLEDVDPGHPSLRGLGDR